MLYTDAFKTSLRSLTHSKTRTLLTMLGIIIGIASVIILMSIGQSAQSLILGKVQGIGSNLVIVMPGAPTNGKFSPSASEQGVIITTLQQRDVASLQREPSITAVGPLVSGQATVVYGNNNATESYQGVTADMFAIRNLKVGQGYAFTESDVTAENPVAVIGPELATTLFGKNSDPINKNIRIKNISFRIVGVLSTGGSGAFGVNQGTIIIIPITVAQKQLLGISHFSMMLIEANPSYTIDFVTSRVKFDLAQNHGITDPNKYDFTIQTQADILSLLGSITSILTLFLAAIASISLVVGGIGIMNIMLVSVTERTREIGLRKAVGATDKDILQQFLIESVLLTLVGGLLGIAFGAAVVGLIYFVATTLFSIGWVFAFPLSAVILAVGVSTIAGLVFGIYPARQAGRKNPIDALRYE
jgi:putative ABC transport system permease protein